MEYMNYDVAPGGRIIYVFLSSTCFTEAPDYSFFFVGCMQSIATEKQLNLKL